jgi:hypothetical protein
MAIKILTILLKKMDLFNNLKKFWLSGNLRDK